jgi:hypothetical protein
MTNRANTIWLGCFRGGKTLCALPEMEINYRRGENILTCQGKTNVLPPEEGFFKALIVVRYYSKNTQKTSTQDLTDL